jgi:hypothetical protein
MSRRSPLVAATLAVLVGSWIVVWFMPAPRICVSTYCGANFNPDALPRPLTFLNWQQLAVLVLGFTIFVVLLALVFRRPRSST